MYFSVKRKDGSTFEEEGLVGPLRVNSCIDVPRQALPQQVDPDWFIVPSITHCPEVVSTEGKGLPPGTCQTNKNVFFLLLVKRGEVLLQASRSIH